MERTAAENGELTLLAELSILAGTIFLAFVVWWFHIKRHSELDERLRNADDSLLTSTGVKTESAIQAPQGSIILPYTVISPETSFGVRENQR